MNKANKYRRDEECRRCNCRRLTCRNLRVWRNFPREVWVWLFFRSKFEEKTYGWLFVSRETEDTEKHETRDRVFELFCIGNEGIDVRWTRSLRSEWKRNFELKRTEIWITSVHNEDRNRTYNENLCWMQPEFSEMRIFERKSNLQRTSHQNFAWVNCNSQVKSSEINLIRSVHCSIAALSSRWAGRGV